MIYQRLAGGSGTPKLSRYLSTAIVANRLGVAPRTVCLWAECGEIPGVKIGRQWRFDEGKFSEWLSSKDRRPALPRNIH